MSTAFVIVTIAAAVTTAFSAGASLLHASWVVQALTEYGVPRSWWRWLGTAKAAGALGLLAGLAVPAVGVAAAVGLILYFAGAVVTVVRARFYSHVPFPVIYAVPVVASLVLAF